jgi:hypothetical protein
MEHIVRDKVLVVYESDLVDIFRGNNYSHEHGFTNYKGVTVLWDEDHDTRVLDLIDSMPVIFREDLLVVHEAEGCVCFLWKDCVPRRFQVGEMICAPRDGDTWNITESIAATKSEIARINL